MSAAKGSLTGPRRDEDPDDSPEPQGGRGQLEGAHAADRASQRCDRRDQCHDPRVARGSVCDLASAQNLLDLEAIIIGGGLGDRLGQPFVDRVIKEMTPHLFVPDNLPVVLRTELGDLSGRRWRGRAGRRLERGDDVNTTPTLPRVLILGGGFAGVGAAQKLDGADAEVVLVDRHDYHTFQPLLYQLATGLLEIPAVGHSLRDLLGRHDNASVHQDTVTAVDLGAREVRFDELAPMSYDYLVLALGAEVNYFGTEGAEEHAFPMYTLPDAVRLKDHLLERWEATDHDPSLAEDGSLNVAVVGGGPTGVETAGAIAELYRADFARDFPGLPHDQARVILVEAGPELFSMFKPRLREYAATALTDRTVEVMTDAMVSSVSPTRVTLKSGEVLDAHTLVWGAGLQGNRLVQTLGLELERGNRIGVGPELTLRDHPEVYVLGDGAAIVDAKTEEALPQLGSVALQSGEHAGESIARQIAGKKPKPFRYRDKGTMATIGRGAAVVQMLGGRTMTGRKAQLAWATVHLALLPTNEDRAKAVVDWVGATATHQRAGRISVGTE